MQALTSAGPDRRPAGRGRHHGGRRPDVRAQLAAIDEAKAALSDADRARLNTAPYEAAVSALEALEGREGAAAPAPVTETGVQVGRFTVTGGSGSYLNINGKDGCPFITASSISDNDDTSDWYGVIFQDIEGRTYSGGYACFVPDGTEIPQGYTLTVSEDLLLTIEEGQTLTNNGTLKVEGYLRLYGVLVNNGALNLGDSGYLEGGGSLQGEGTFTSKNV